MHMLKLVAALALIAVSLTTITGISGVSGGKARAAGPGNCGEYMYWQDGKCVDARDRNAEAWSASMGKKATW
jgi:hypothetical protein